MSGIAADVVMTVLVTVFMIRPAVRDLLHPEKVTSKFQSGAPDTVKQFVPVVSWFQLIAALAFLGFLWLYFR